MDSQLETAMRHEISVNRLAAHIVSERVNPAFVNIAELTRRLLDDYSPDMTGRDMEALRKRTEKALAKRLNEMWEQSTKDLEEFSEYEADYQAKTLAGFAEVSAQAVALTAIAKKYDLPLVLTSGDKTTVGLWSEYVAGNIDATTKLVDSEIRAGRENGLTNSQVVSRLVGTKKRQYDDGLLTTKSKPWAENLVRTGSSHYANAARDAVAESMSEDIEGKVFSNVFDNRTTPQCLHHGQQAHQGKIYKLNDPKAPRIPLHHRCRSMWLFKIPGVDPFSGTKAAVGGKKSAEAAEDFAKRDKALAEKRDQRAEQRAEGKETPETPSKVRYKGKKDADIFQPGQIDANVSPQQFMENQPDWFVQSSLGKTRAKLFREGGLPIEKFTDTMGRPLTLKQMRELDEYDAYFRKAGL
jgi:hypothetical protein